MIQFGFGLAKSRRYYSTCFFLFFEFFFYPRHQKVDDLLLRFGGEGDAFLDAIPFEKATAATTGAGVLRNEDGVPAHRRLLAVVLGLGRGKALPYEVFRVGADGGEPHLLDIVFVLFGEVKAASEGGSRQF